MIFFSALPLRQKVLLGLTICFGLFTLFGVTLNLISIDQQKTCIFVIGFGLPTLLLVLDTIVDLDTPPIFVMWLIIAMICFAFCILEYGNAKYFIPEIDSDSFKSKYATSALKAPLVFLIVYYFLNKLNKKLIRHPIVNTFHAKSFHHSGENRTIRGSDVVCNILLFVTIIFSTLFGL